MNDLLELSNSKCKQYFTYEQFGPEYLTPAEFDFVAAASDKRKKEFSTGRFCARKALDGLNVSNTNIPMGGDREPIWPTGVLGSISHSQHLTGAIVGKSTDFFSMGLDIEKIGGIKPDMWALIYTDAEQAFLHNIPGGQLELFSTLLFSFKESFYKFQFPVSRQFIDFKDVEIQFLNNKAHVNIIKAPRVVKDIPWQLVKFYWKSLDNYVITCCILEIPTIVA
jgi:4'-phosphopantetheinyl transferase EntD